MSRGRIGGLLLAIPLAVLEPRSGLAQDTAASVLLDSTEQVVLLARLSQYDRVAPLTGRLVSRGSGGATILVNRWIDDFAPLHPVAVFNVLGVGSSAGLAALRTGEADMMPSSRPLTAAEVDSFTAAVGHPPLQIVVALDALGVYVNKYNPIEKLTFDQLEAIYSRAPRGGRAPADQWRDVGVPAPFGERLIARYSLDSLNSIYSLVREQVLHGEDYRFDVKFEPVPRGMVQDVGADDGAIALASIIFATPRTRLVPLQGTQGAAYPPTQENVASGRYPLARPIYLIVNQAPGTPLPPLVGEFVRFAVSRRGQQIAAFGGNYPISPEQQRRALDQLR
jgi:phosphate transport system substrate-binding protein